MLILDWYHNLNKIIFQIITNGVTVSDGYKIKRVGNIYDDFKPAPWNRGGVKILYSPDGEAVGFYAVESSSITSLPNEIFNHQMKELDIEEPEQIADFMSKYGMVYHGFTEAAEEMDEYCKRTCPYRWGTLVDEEVDALVKSLAMPKYPWPDGRYETIQLWIGEYKRLSTWKCDSSEWEQKLFLVSYEEVKACIETMTNCVSLAKAIAKTDVEQEIETMMGFAKGEFYDESLYLDTYLNSHLTNIHPKVGVLYVGEGLPQNPSYNDSYEEYESYTKGSFMRALALQIRDFNIHLGEYRECKECGEIFVKRQSRKPNMRVHSDGEFCCDKCKNRFTQREYRKSPGYKLKQAEKRAKKPTPPADPGALE